MTSREKQKLYRLLFVATIGVLAFGTVFYHFVEGWSWIDSYYFCVVTLATIGYGDFIPQTDFAKIFTTLYIFIGVGIIAAFLRTFLAGQGERFIKKHPNFKIHDDKLDKEQDKP